MYSLPLYSTDVGSAQKMFDISGFVSAGSFERTSLIFVITAPEDADLTGVSPSENCTASTLLQPHNEIVITALTAAAATLADKLLGLIAFSFPLDLMCTVLFYHTTKAVRKQ